MDKKHLTIIGILLVSIFGTGFILFHNNENQKPAAFSQENIALYDYVHGDTKRTEITYISHSPEYIERTVETTNDPHITNSQVQIISYEIETINEEKIYVLIDKNKNTILLNGLRPKDKITVFENKKAQLSFLPADWAGRLLLSNDDIQIANNLCIELVSQKLIACYASNTGGVS